MTGPVRFPDSDEVLARNFVDRGDRSAFETLVRNHLTTLRRLVAAVGPRSVEDREDVLQETLIRVYRALPGYRFDAPVTTWMYRIARNAALDVHRSRSRREARERRVFTEQEAFGVSRNPEELALDRLRARSLKDLFYRLRETDRQLLLLREKEGLSMEEIAHILEITPGTVKSRLSRARRRARKLYEEAESWTIAAG